MFHWLSDDVVRFKTEVGVEEKTLMPNTHKMAIPAPRRTRRAADDAIIMTYINTQRLASKYTITACRAKVKFKVSVRT